MKSIDRKHLSLSVLVICLLFAVHPACAETEDFEIWLSALREEARERGISEKTLDAALTGVRPIQEVIDRDRRQPESTQDFWDYLDIRVSEKRIVQGMNLLLVHGELLQSVQDRYGVPPRFLVAIWGLESNFGTYQGKFPIIGSLVTLAHDERRSAFFRAELLAALTIVDEGHIDIADMTGSWAGAMGQIQFMPSTFLRFAADADGDGRKDIWHSYPDIFESAAQYLTASGWERGYTWGREVLIPHGFQPAQADLKTGKLLSEWQDMGIRRIIGDDLPELDIRAYLVFPAGNNGPAFLVYDNYRAILRWNRSHLYAIAVGHLADRFTGRSPLQRRHLHGTRNNPEH